MAKPNQGFTPITMVIMSTNPLVRMGLQAVIKARTYIQFVGEATSVDDAEALIARQKPHLVMLEAEEEADLLDLIHKLKALAPNIKIILLSRIEQAPRAWKALSSGIDGIVLTIQPSAALLATIDHIYHDSPGQHRQN